MCECKIKLRKYFSWYKITTVISRQNFTVDLGVVNFTRIKNVVLLAKR